MLLVITGQTLCEPVYLKHRLNKKAFRIGVIFMWHIFFVYIILIYNNIGDAQ